MTDFGPVLRRFRKAAGLSQERLAAESGVSVEAIKTLEAGRRRYPRVQTVDLLSVGLGLDADERAELKAAAARPKSSDRLPAEVADFVGRAEQIATLSALLTGGERAPGVVVISAVAGMGGVGKTALAVRVARELTGRFADGVLYVNLRGFGVGGPMTPLEALNTLLQQLGFALQRPPESAEEAAGLFRTACAARRLLVVLDNAATVDQVLPLLPGTSNCAVIVTSRRALVGLPGAQPLALGVPPEDEALALLTAAAGRDRIEPDPAAARHVVSLCGSLPLALRIAGSRLAAEPTWTTADLVRRLADETARLDVLTDADRGVRATIALSLTGAGAAAAIFGALGMHEGDELDLKVAARLVDLPEEAVEPLLEHLVDLHLLESPLPRRYRFHDLVRAHARELAWAQTSAAERAAAHERVMALYVVMAWGVWPVIRRDRREWLGERLLLEVDEVEASEAMAWLDIEASDILAAASRTPITAATLVRLAAGMSPFFSDRRRSAEAVQLGELAMAALHNEPDPHHPFGVSLLSYHVAQHYGALSNFEPAARHMRVAVELAREHGYNYLLIHTQLGLARFLERLDQVDEGMVQARAGLELAVRSADGSAEGIARFTLGILAGRLGRPAEQDREYARAVELVRRNDTYSLIWLVRTIGDAYRRCGRSDTASSWLRAELTETRAAGSTIGLADHLQVLGAAEVDLEAYESARATLEEALTLIVGNRGELEAAVRHTLGSALAGLGEPALAHEQWRTACEIYRRYGLPQVDEVLQLLELVDDGEDRQETEG